MYLNCKTYFSFRYGTFSTAELVDAAREHGVSALALTNINSTCDVWEFVRLCREAGIKPVPGVEVRNGDRLLYLLLAASARGLSRIHEFLSAHLMEKKDFPEAADNYPFFTHPEDGFVIYPLGEKLPEKLLSHERIGLLPQDLTRLYRVDLKKFADKFVVRQPVTVQNNEYYQVHKLLRAIDRNVLGTMLSPESKCSPEETFLSPASLIEKFRQYPFMITNSYRLLDACQIDMDYKPDKNKKFFSASLEDDKILLEKLTADGFLARYGPKDKTAEERLRKELQIISELGFNSYFLINWDIVRYAQSRGFYHVGRGSGANSIVAYCLGITDVDPIELNLYFERFLNPERTSPPDFDIDFSHADRDEVIDYIFKRYGKKHVALLGSFSTFQDDAIIHELGKVFGMIEEDIKKLQRTGVAEDDNGRFIQKYGALIKGFPNIMSLHPCGILISEKPINDYATLFMPPKGFATAQIDMFTAEDIGLNKFDILSQRGLSHIKTCLELVKKNHNIDIDITDKKKFREDPLVRKQIREANTIGCFYIESPAMRQLLKKLGCDDYLTLVAASSIIRPGVAESGMMRMYLYYYHNRDKIVYLHPVFEEHLSETFGVMVFQESVMIIAHSYAGLSLTDTDVLRRAMSGKYRTNNEFRMIREKFFQGAENLGRPPATTQEVWRQMESFYGYSFNKAHSASFAVESYMSLYLKTHFPMEFMVAVINNFGGFYSTELYFMELLKTGCRIHPPSVNDSDQYTNIRNGEAYTGLVHVKGLQQKLVETILEDRRLRGPFHGLYQFIGRINPGLEQLNKLVSVGAFGFTGLSKKKLLWDGDLLQKKNQAALNSTAALFDEPPAELELPDMQDQRLDDLHDQIELLNFTLSNPFELVNDDPSKYLRSAELPSHLGGSVTMLAYFIARKHVITKTNREMFFGTFLDSELGWIDTVHFPESAKRYPLHTAGFYRITGKVVEDFGVYSLEAHTMKEVGYKHSSYANLG